MTDKLKQAFELSRKTAKATVDAAERARRQRVADTARFAEREWARLAPIRQFAIRRGCKISDAFHLWKHTPYIHQSYLHPKLVMRVNYPLTNALFFSPSRFGEVRIEILGTIDEPTFNASAHAWSASYDDYNEKMVYVDGTEPKSIKTPDLDKLADFVAVWLGIFASGTVRT